MHELLCSSGIPSESGDAKLGLTQEQLAAKAGVRQRTISDIERSAAARFDTVLRALAALDLELVVRPRTKGSSHDIEKLF